MFDPETGTAQIWEPQVILTQTHRWSRQKKRGVLHQGLRSVFHPGYPGSPMESPAEAYTLMNRANLWRKRLDEFLNNNRAFKKNAQLNSFISVSNEDYDFLQQACFGARTVLDIPVETLVGPLPDPAPMSTPRKP